VNSTITPQLLAVMATTTAGMWMAVAGVRKRALEWKRRKRFCPACGREIRGRTCVCTRS
jgi:NADH pyrophosphatase NudC (nudix superfamily)